MDQEGLTLCKGMSRRSSWMTRASCVPFTPKTALCRSTAGSTRLNTNVLPVCNGGVPVWRCQ